MTSSKVRTPRGFFDRFGSEATQLTDIQTAFFNLARRYGAREFQASPLGFADTFFRDTSLDRRKTYQFRDHSNRELVLNCDSLPAVMRHYAAHGDGPERYMFRIPVFRYRNTRLRHYHHLGITFLNEANDPYFDRLLLDLFCTFANEISSKSICVRINPIGVYIDLFRYFGATESDARQYFVKRRFDKSRAQLPLLLIDDGQRRLAAVLSHLQRIPRSSITDVVDEALLALPEGIARKFHRQLCDVASLVNHENVSDVVCDFNDFHSSEFFSNIGFQLYFEGEKTRIADGGSYHGYGQVFCKRINTVYSAIFRHEDLLRHADKMRASRRVLGVYLVTKMSDEARSIFESLRSTGLCILEDNSSKSAKVAVQKLKDRGASHFCIFGNRELHSRKIQVIDLDTNERSETDLEQVGSSIGAIR